MLRKAIFVWFIAGLSFVATGRDWYAAPDARMDGDGSFARPWPLSKALTQRSIAGGDILYLRGGTYKGPGFKSTLTGTPGNYITVRSATNEWAKITDEARGVLLTPMSGVISNTWITIAGSENWSDASNLRIGEDILYCATRNGTNWWVIPGWGGSAALPHWTNSEVLIENCLLDHEGSFVIFRDFELTCISATNRTTGKSRSLASGLNLSAAGKANKAVNLVIHNVGHPGIGFWQQGAGGEINGCLIWGVGDYYNEGQGVRGSGIYAQNQGGLAAVKNTISFRNFTGGMKVFGESGPVRDFSFEHNVIFGTQPGYGTLSVTSGSTATSNTWVRGNILMGSPQLSYESRNNQQQYFCNNTIVHGAIAVSDTFNSVYTNNVLLFPKNALSGSLISSYKSGSTYKTNLNVTWDHNTYYWGLGASPFNWTFVTADVGSLNSAGGGLLRFSNDSGKAWTDWSGFDKHSKYYEGLPLDYIRVFIQPSDYDSNRWHIAVVSACETNLASINPAELGFKAGDHYVLMDVQNWPVESDSGRYTEGSIMLPLNLTHVSPIPGLKHFANEHTNVRNPGLFNAFVLIRTFAGPRILKILGP